MINESERREREREREREFRSLFQLKSFQISSKFVIQKTKLAKCGPRFKKTCNRTKSSDGSGTRKSFSSISTNSIWSQALFIERFPLKSFHKKISNSPSSRSWPQWCGQHQCKRQAVQHESASDAHPVMNTNLTNLKSSLSLNFRIHLTAALHISDVKTSRIWLAASYGVLLAISQRLYWRAISYHDTARWSPYDSHGYMALQDLPVLRRAAQRSNERSFHYKQILSDAVRSPATKQI